MNTQQNPAVQQMLVLIQLNNQFIDSLKQILQEDPKILPIDQFLAVLHQKQRLERLNVIFNKWLDKCSDEWNEASAS